MKIRLAKYLTITVRVALGAVFLYAGLLKIGDPVAFAGNIAAYRVLPYFGNYLTAAILPWLEVICGVLLVLGIRTRSAASVLVLLNLIFMVFLASAIARGLEIDCGCFRPGEKTSPAQALTRDILLLAGSVYFARRRSDLRQAG